jgi:hypothetical protein
MVPGVDSVYIDLRDTRRVSPTGEAETRILTFERVRQL